MPDPWEGCNDIHSMFLTFYFFEVSFESFIGSVVILLCTFQAQVHASAFVDYAAVDSPRMEL